MRIAVFEWLCGGGLHASPPQDVPSSLLLEGWAMLSTLVKQMNAAGHDSVTIVDDRLLSDSQLLSLSASQFCRFEDYPKSGRRTGIERTVDAWLDCATDQRIELAIVIAPEIDGILQYSIEAFQSNGMAILNCTGDFLNRTCDKWLTACRLEQAGLPHPTTYLASAIPRSNEKITELWCLKSRLGAGCDGMQIASYAELMTSVKSLMDADQWIVQPWMNGESFSCTGIVDRHGIANWLPLVTQSFQRLSLGGSTESLLYQGGKIVHPTNGPQRPVELLDKVLTALSDGQFGQALGWVGVDLLLRPDGQWVIIEVNPRLTTSILGLCQAAPYNLAKAMIDAYKGHSTVSQTNATPYEHEAWKSLDFTPNAELT